LTLRLDLITREIDYFDARVKNKIKLCVNLACRGYFYSVLIKSFLKNSSLFNGELTPTDLVAFDAIFETVPVAAMVPKIATVGRLTGVDPETGEDRFTDNVRDASLLQFGSGFILGGPASAIVSFIGDLLSLF
jgi:hypothetical protein